jgi:membrane protein DedA with SNARE-associated domain
MSGQLAELVATHGFLIVPVLVGIESMGIPAPGETALVTAAIFAGTTHRLNIALVIALAAAGAIVGDNIGYALGRRYGYGLMMRYRYFLHLDAGRIKLGQYLFARHGGKVVFFGRFVALLRALAAVLAGVNGMHWRRFLFFNAAGGIIWALAYGSAGYVFGRTLEEVRGRTASITIALAVLAFAAGLWWVRRHEAALVIEAERANPGPLSLEAGRGSRASRASKSEAAG